MAQLPSEDIQRFLADIRAQKAQLPMFFETGFDAKMALERWRTLTDLEACLSSPNVDEEALKALLKTRWTRIRGTALAYTEQPFDSVNQLCYAIAQKLAPLPSTIEELNALPVGVGPYFLLMPSLVVAADVGYDNIHNLRLHEFVLSDDDTRYIPIVDCLSDARTNDDGDLRHVVSKTNDEFPKLTPTEVARVVNHSKYTNDYYCTIQAFRPFNHEVQQWL